MQIELPESLDLEARAKAAGFESVEAYVLRAIERMDEPKQSGQTSTVTPPRTRADLPYSDEEIERILADKRPPGELTKEEWLKRFDVLATRRKSYNPNVDDSRDAAYPDE